MSNVYADLHKQHIVREREREKSALRILPLLFDHVAPKSVVDIGCGIGTWLAVARKLGVKEIRGVEGPWLDKSLLRIEPDLITLMDLEAPFDLGRKFDLAICLEVAEHLSPDAANLFVDSLTRHADLILFSAAIPFQGGHGHINEQWPSYWKSKFHQHNFVVIDFIRAKIWSDRSVVRWLRQNILLYSRLGLIQSSPKLAALYQKVSGVSPLDVAHPYLYMRLHAEMANTLSRLAKLYHEQGHHAEAEPLYQRSLAIVEKALGPDHRNVAKSLNNLAGFYYARGRYAAAEPLLKRSLAILEKALGPEHPLVAQSLENYAALVRNTGRSAEAAEMEARAKAIRAKHAQDN